MTNLKIKLLIHKIIAYLEKYLEMARSARSRDLLLRYPLIR